MGGLLSDKTRDVIAIIGLVLAVLQTVLAFKALNATSSDTKNSLGRDRAAKPLLALLLECLSSPSSGQIRAMLLGVIGCLCAVGATTWLLTYVTPILPDPVPTSWIQLILAMVALLSPMAEPPFLAFFVEGTGEWLEKNGASKTQINIFVAFSLGLGAGLLFLCVLALWFGDADGWVRNFAFFEVSGIGMLVAILVSGGIEQYFDERSANKERAMRTLRGKRKRK